MFFYVKIQGKSYKRFLIVWFKAFFFIILNRFNFIKVLEL